MKAIFKNDNVYVVVQDKEAREDVGFKNVENLILCDDYRCSKKENSLYGGRVCLKIPKYNSNGYVHYKDDYCHIIIDGIGIDKFYDNVGVVWKSNEFSWDKIAAYLNQIENLGVDSFLENYKLQLQELKKEFESMKEDLQSELAVNYDENKASKLDSIKNTILSITCVIFSLLINMNAGLNNHHYINAYNEIINMYF